MSEHAWRNGVIPTVCEQGHLERCSWGWLFVVFCEFRSSFWRLNLP